MLFKAWWADLPTRRGPHTIRIYRSNTIRWLADEGKDPLTVGSGEIRSYLGTLRPQFAETMRSALADLFEFCERRGLRANPIKEKPIRMRSRRRIKRGLTEDELRRLIVAAVWAGQGRRRFNGERLAWQILAHYSLGLRPGEFVGLTRDKIVLDGAAFSRVLITETKTNMDRVVPAGALARQALGVLLSDGSYKLTNIGVTQHWYRVRRAARLADLPPEKCRPYALRHTFATHLRQRGVADVIISELMGHSDLRPMKWYDVPTSDELREAVELL